MKIVMISDYVDPKSYTKKEWNDEVDFLDAVQREVKAAGAEFEYLEIKSLHDLKESLKKYDKKDVVIFNWCEYLEEKENTAHLVTKYLESQGFIFTGAGTKCLELTTSKERTKEKLIEHGIPTPKYTVIKKASDFANVALSYPLMLKLEDRHSSAGITNENVVYNQKQLIKVASRLLKDYGTNVIAEEFIDGQEYTVTVWGNGMQASVLTCAKISFKDRRVSKIYTEQSKENTASDDYDNTILTVCDRRKDKTIIKNVSQIVLAAYRALNFLDYGRFELIKKNGKNYVIDCNPNEYIGPDSFLYNGSKQFGYNYGETLLQICKFAVKRYEQ